MAVNSFREDEYMENTDKKKILSRLLSYLLDYKLAIAGVLVCMGITVGISLVPIADRRGDRSLHSTVRF